MLLCAGCQLFTSHDRRAGPGSGIKDLGFRECTGNSMLDRVLVGDFAGVAALAVGQEVLEGLVVDLYEAGLQLVFPPLLLQRIHRIQDLPAAPITP